MTCGQFEATLAELLDGSVGERDHARCVRHAASCARCFELVEPMGTMLRPASVAPPATLLTEVIGKTAGVARRRRWAETWRGWMLRPRFACEAAYVGVAVFCVACATLDDVPVATRRDRAGVVIHEICSEAGVLVDRAASLLQNLQPEAKEKS